MTYVFYAIASNFLTYRQPFNKLKINKKEKRSRNHFKVISTHKIYFVRVWLKHFTFFICYIYDGYFPDFLFSQFVFFDMEIRNGWQMATH